MSTTKHPVVSSLIRKKNNKITVRTRNQITIPRVMLISINNT